MPSITAHGRLPHSIGPDAGSGKGKPQNELVWIMAPHKGWGKAGINGDGFETSDYLLTAVDANGDPYPQNVQDGLVADPNFDWTWGQHASMLLPDGNLFVFDNGYNRHFTKVKRIAVLWNTVLTKRR